MRRPPRTTLYPYTTHIRSASQEATGGNTKEDKRYLTWNHAQSGEITLEYAGCEFATRYHGLEFGEDYDDNIDCTTLNIARDLNEDTIRFRDYRASIPNRSESTRLNSSHITISYAVFCLKKKKTKKIKKHKQKKTTTSDISTLPTHH